MIDDEKMAVIVKMTTGPVGAQEEHKLSGRLLRVELDKRANMPPGWRVVVAFGPDGASTRAYVPPRHVYLDLPFRFSDDDSPYSEITGPRLDRVLACTGFVCHEGQEEIDTCRGCRVHCAEDGVADD